MSTKKTLLERIVQSMIGSPKKKETMKKRSLQVESLEVRELLSVVGFHSVQDAVEGGQAGYVRIQRDDTAGELTINYGVDWHNSGCDYNNNPGWAKNGTDFNWLQETNRWNDDGTVTFANGQQYVDIAINAIADQWIEGTEQLTLHLLSADNDCGCGCDGSNSSSYTVNTANASATVSIIDSTIPVTVGIETLQNAAEGGQNGIFRIWRDNVSTALVVNYQLDYRNSGYCCDNYVGWAKNGTDFNWLPGTNEYNNYGSVSFAAGQEYADIVIEVIDNELIEGDKTILIELLPPENSFIYEIDSTGNTASLFLIDDDHANHAPVLQVFDSIELEIGAAEYGIDLSTIFSDSDIAQWGDSLTYSVIDVENLNLASPTLENGHLYLDFTPNVLGTSKYIVRASDSQGLFVDAEITVSIYSNIPEARIDRYSVVHGNTLSIDAENGVLVNDHSINGSLSSELVDSPQHGTIQFNADGSFVYLAQNGFAGQDCFTYRTINGQYTSEPVEVMIDVTNTVPILPPRQCFNYANTAFSATEENGLLSGLVDAENDSLQAVLVDFSDTDKGTLTVNADGSFTFIPTNGFIGTVQFTYAVMDFYGTSEPTTMTLDIRNSKSIAANDIYSVTYGQTLQINSQHGLLANDISQQNSESLLTQLNGQQISIISQPEHGTIQIQQDGSFTYIGESGFIGEDKVVYRVTDASGDSWDATVTLVATAPKPASQGDVVTLDSNGTFQVSTLLANDFMQGTDASLMTDLYHIAVSDGQYGAVTLNDDGTVEYTPQDGYGGVDILTYQILDSNNNVVGKNAILIQPNSPLPNLPLQPVPDGYNTDASSGTFGQLSVGGSNIQISTSTVFVPSNPGNWQSEDTFTNQGGTIITNDDGTTITGDDVETLTVLIISQDFGNGEWSYSEFVTYSYLIVAGDDTYWGGYTSVLAASFVNGSYQSAYLLTVSDNFLINDKIIDDTDTSSLHLTTITGGGTTETTIVTQNHNIQSSSGFNRNYHDTFDSVFYEGLGTYSCATTGGSVHGIILQGGSNITDTWVNVIQSGNADNWSTIGTQHAGISETWSNIYDGAGYDFIVSQGEGYYSDMFGKITEKGHDSNSLSLTVDGILGTDGNWEFIGGGISGESNGEFYSNMGEGRYSQYVTQPGHSWSISGTHSADTTYDKSSSENITWGLNEDWGIINGNGCAYEYSLDSYDYDGSGSYFRNGGSEGNLWSSSGTLEQSGGNSEIGDYHVISNYLGGLWSNTGWGCGSEGEYSNSSYDGSGSYTSTFDKNDSNFSMNGTTTEGGSDSSSMKYFTQSNLVNGVWQTSGHGCDDGSSSQFSSYEGSGSFRMKVDAPNAVGNPNYTGTASHNGNSDSYSSWCADWSLQNGIWNRTSGKGDSGGSDSSHIEFEGSVNTTEKYVKEGISYSTSTTHNVDGNEQNESCSSQDFHVVNGNWAVQDGSGYAVGSSHLHSDYTISNGTYTYEKTDHKGVPGNEHFSGQSANGTVVSDGSVTDDYSYDINYEWQNSAWVTTGTFDYSYSVNEHFKREGSGNFWENTETTTATSHFYSGTSGEITSEKFETSSGFSRNYTEKLNADGSRTLENGGNSHSYSSEDFGFHWTGTGNFESTNSEDDGSIVEYSGESTFQKDWTKVGSVNEGKKIIDHQWKLNSGTSSLTETDKSTLTKNGTGTMTVGQESYSITTAQTDVTDFTETNNGNVRKIDPNDENSEKVWKYSGDAIDKLHGTYTITAPLRETDYSRPIFGGTVSGTVKESETKGSSYEINITSGKTEDSPNWETTAGTKKYENSIEYTQSYEGSGSYDYLSGLTYLIGSITESNEYSVKTAGVKKTLTYNTTNKTWDETNDGTVTYKEEVKFTDSGNGSYNNGAGTINDRTADYHLKYTETLHLDTGNTDYDLLHYTASSYDAVETAEYYNGMDGSFKWTDNYTIDSTISVFWWTDAVGLLTDYFGTQTHNYSEDVTKSFAIGDNGNEIYDTYYFENSWHASENTVERLNVDRNQLGWGYDSFEDMIWSDSFWTLNSLTGKQEYVTDTGWSKSGTNDEASGWVGNIYFNSGTSTYSEDDSYHKKLTKNFSYTEPPTLDPDDYGCSPQNIDYIITGNGIENSSHHRSDSFTGDEQTNDGCDCCSYCYYYYDDNFYCGYYRLDNVTTTQNGSSRSHSSRDSSLTYTWDDNVHNWSITGTGTTESGFGYNWSDILTGDHQYGTGSINTGSNHDETGTVHWNYNNGGWHIDSVEGGGSGAYHSYFQWDSSRDYSKEIYVSSVTGNEQTHISHDRDENWNVNFSLVAGRAVRETDGDITIVIDKKNTYSEGGESHECTDTTENLVAGIGYDWYNQKY